MMEELLVELVVVVVAEVIVVAAVVLEATGTMEVSWPSSVSSLAVDHCELMDDEDELRRIVC